MDILKLEDLHNINRIAEEYTLLYNNGLSKEYTNSISLQDLLDNSNMIHEVFTKNQDKMKFDIILNSRYHEDLKLLYILDLKKSTIEEFTHYVMIAPYCLLNEKSKTKINIYYNKFVNSSNYEALRFFNSIKRD